MTKSEEMMYNVYFNAYPLTLARKLILEIENRIVFKSEL